MLAPLLLLTLPFLAAAIPVDPFESDPAYRIPGADLTGVRAHLRNTDLLKLFGEDSNGRCAEVTVVYTNKNEAKLLAFTATYDKDGKETGNTRRQVSAEELGVHTQTFRETYFQAKFHVDGEGVDGKDDNRTYTLEWAATGPDPDTDHANGASVSVKDFPDGVVDLPDPKEAEPIKLIEVTRPC